MSAIDQTQINKFYNLQKLLLFPYGIILIGLLWTGAFFPIFNGIFDEDPFLWWAKILFIIAGWIFIAFSITMLNFYFKKSKHKQLKAYLLILPENWDMDGYVCSDIQNDMRSRLESDLQNFVIEVPSILKRYHLTKAIENYKKDGKDFFKAKAWKKIHKRLRGNFYIFGNLKSRKSNGTENLVFHNLQMVIAYSSSAKEEHIAELINALNTHSASNVLINRNYEYEQLGFLSASYVGIFEFLLGIVFLISGYPSEAYNLHSKVIKKKRTSFRNEQLITDAKSYLAKEFVTIMNILLLKEEFDDALKLLKLHEESQGANEHTRVMRARTLIMSCKSNEEYVSVIPQAIDVLSGSIEDESLRAVILQNRAYVYFLAGNVDEAEKALRAISKYPHANIYKSVIEYCDWVLKREDKNFEKGVALYTRALALKKTSANVPDIRKAFSKVIEYYGNSETYFALRALSELRHLT